MTAAAVLAFGASTALGEGDDALGVSSPGDHAPCALGVDDELRAAGLRRPHAGRVRGLGDPSAPRVPGAPDRATLLLSRAFEACARALDGVLPGWRDRRVGLALGTSSGGMRTFEQIVDPQASAPPPGWFEATYLGPLVASDRPVAFEPSALVMGACASSTLALGIARAWLVEGACDVAIAGGFDALSVFVAAGFEALRATSAFSSPRPFRADRDGLVLGEGAALLALVRGDAAIARSAPVLGFVRGFGASCDAVHVTAPDRTGEGLARAARAALRDARDDAGDAAGDPVVDVVSAHGTATVFNDAAEAQAIRAVLGEGPTPVHALKGSVGHTLGAAGAVETLSSLACLRAGILPASVGDGPVEPGLEVPIVSASRDLRVALKLSAAFGGANAALVLSKSWTPNAATSSTGEPSPAAGPAPRGTYVSDVVALTADLDAAVDASSLAESTGLSVDRLARTDELTRLTIAAVARLEGTRRERGRPGLRGAGIVVGHGLATFDTNAVHQARIASAGAARAEPRRFPYTTPNACAGEAAIAFGLTGPAFAVGGGAHGGIEALAVAATLVSAGHADRIVVVAVDAAGEASRRAAPETPRGAVAFVVTREPGDGLVERASVRLAQMPERGRPLADPRSVAAHTALLDLAAPPGARTELAATTPWGLSAAASIRWLQFDLFLESRFVQRC